LTPFFYDFESHFKLRGKMSISNIAKIFQPHSGQYQKIESEMLPPVIPDDSSKELFYLF